MKVLVIVVLALVAVSQATPYLRGGDYGNGGRHGGGGHGGGSEYDHSGYNRGDNGYLDEGYGGYGFQEGHDIHHQENEFDKSIHQHQVSDHNSGGVSSGGHGGHLQSGHGGFESGLNNHGREFGYGYYGI